MSYLISITTSIKFQRKSWITFLVNLKATYYGSYLYFSLKSHAEGFWKVNRSWVGDTALVCWWVYGWVWCWGKKADGKRWVTRVWPGSIYPAYSLDPSLFPAYHDMNCPLCHVLLPCSPDLQPSIYGLKSSQTVSQNNPLLLLLVGVKYFVSALRK